MEQWSDDTLISMIGVITFMNLDRARKAGVMDRGMYRRNVKAFRIALDNDREKVRNNTGTFNRTLAINACFVWEETINQAIANLKAGKAMAPGKTR